MRSGNLYRHISTLDTDLYVHAVKYAGPRYIKVQASIVYRKDHYVFERKVFLIKREDLWKWNYVPS